MHAGLSDVWVIEQQNPTSLAAHLANRRPWDSHAAAPEEPLI
jgi:ADP-glucose pyrophosphorylase